VSVPASMKIAIAMSEDNWAFGEIRGVPRHFSAEEF
jgi:hypothetical protein